MLMTQDCLKTTIFSRYTIISGANCFKKLELPSIILNAIVRYKKIVMPYYL